MPRLSHIVLALFLLLALSLGGFLLAEVKNAHIAEHHAGAMAAEADVAILVEEAGMILVVDGVRIDMPTVGCHIVSLACLADVALCHHGTVNGDLALLHDLQTR